MWKAVILSFLILSPSVFGEDYFIYYSVSTCKIDTPTATNKIIKFLREEGKEKCYQVGGRYYEIEWSISLMREKKMCGGMAGNLVFNCYRPKVQSL